MTIKLNGALGRCLAGLALGALIPIAFVPTAAAQWRPPWAAPFPSKLKLLCNSTIVVSLPTVGDA